MILLHGTTSQLEVHLNDPILLRGGNWFIGLTAFSTYHTIPNVDETNNRIIINNREIRVPTGSYEIEDIEKYLNREIKPDFITIYVNLNTLRVSIKCTKNVYFPRENSLATILGFEDGTSLKSDFLYETDHLVNIFKVGTVRLECNVAQGAFLNGQRTHSIYEFFPCVDHGEKIYLSPNPVIYHKVITDTIGVISIRITDQSNRLINFRGEEITVHLHLKQI